MNWIGRWLIAIGLLHTLVGLVFTRGVLATLWREGLFNTVNGQPDREMVFWFFFTGFLMIAVGGSVHHLERHRLRIPTLVVSVLLLMLVIGAVLMPVSAIWLLVPPVAGMILRNRQVKE